MAYCNLFCEDKLAVGKRIHPKHSSARITDGHIWSLKRKSKGRTQSWEHPALCGVWGRVLAASLTLAMCKCKEAAAQTQDLPVTVGSALPVAPGPPFKNMYVFRLREKNIPGTMPSVSGASSEVSIVTLWTFTLLENTKTLCVNTNAPGHTLHTKLS